MESDSNTPCPDATPTAFELAEEHACARYLTARKDMLALGRRAASLAQLVNEQPHRLDYQAVWTEVDAIHREAVARTRLAWQVWQRAQQRTDAEQPAPLAPSFTGTVAAVA
jgi:hypothetical protein